MPSLSTSFLLFLFCCGGGTLGFTKEPELDSTPPLSPAGGLPDILNPFIEDTETIGTSGSKNITLNIDLDNIVTQVMVLFMVEFKAQLRYFFRDLRG